VSARREYGTGSVYRRSSDGRWIGSVEAGWNPDGSRRRVTVSAKTEAEARRQGSETNATRSNATGSPTRTPASPSSQWADQWLTMPPRNVRLRPTPTASTRHGRQQVGSCPPSDTSGSSSSSPPATSGPSTDALVKAGKSPSSSALRTHCRPPHGHAQGRHRRGATPIPAARPVHRQSPTKLRRQRPHATSPSNNAIRVLEQAALHVGRRLDGGSPRSCRGCGRASASASPGRWSTSTRKPRRVMAAAERSPTCRAAQKASAASVCPDGYECRQLDGHAGTLVRPKTAKGRRVIPLVPWMTTALTAWRDVAPTVNRTASSGPTLRRVARIATRRTTDAEWYALQDAADVRHPRAAATTCTRPAHDRDAAARGGHRPRP
jgi:hypothetical protein